MATSAGAGAPGSTEDTVPFPQLSPNPSQTQVPTSPRSPTTANQTPTSPATPTRRRNRSSSAAQSIASAASRVLEADPPPGFLAATGVAASKAPTLSDIRRGSVDDPRVRRSSDESRANRRRFGSTASRKGSTGATLSPVAFPALKEVETGNHAPEPSNIPHAPSSSDSPSSSKAVDVNPSATPAWTPPPPLPWTTSFLIALRTYSHWVLTLPGFLITVYGLNVVAWGGMLFLLLCNAAPAMCTPTCDDINSPRRIWIEIDSQILNALFCVTGFGLAPWRFRDLWFWAIWAFAKGDKAKNAERRLAGIHRGWYRLSGSEGLNVPLAQAEMWEGNPALPVPLSKAPVEPLTRVRARPTRTWKLTYVIHMNVWNTFFQCVLSGFMWGLNRYDRPSWSTGLFVALACVVAALGGLMMFQEGKRVKKVEGYEIGTEERKARGWDGEADEERGIGDMHTAVGEAVERTRMEGRGKS